jgi:xanthine/CO dehydrogenase XdhC/CoxF family maturation factor
VVLVTVADFLTPLTDQLCIEGETATFKCETTHKGKKVTWLKDGIEIKPDQHFVVKDTGTEHTLTIKDTVLYDEATYTAVLGSKQTTAKLVVEGRSNFHFTEVQPKLLYIDVCIMYTFSGRLDLNLNSDKFR